MAVRIVIEVPPGCAELDKAQLRSVMRGAGSEIAAKARAMIRAGGATARRKAKRVSAPGSPPVNRTGGLASGLRVRLRADGTGVTVRDVAAARDGAFYALFLEKGATGGGGDTADKRNILKAGELGRGGKLLRGQDRMKRGAINQARALAPHPFMEPALDAVVADGLADRVRDAIASGLAFRRCKR